MDVTEVFESERPRLHALAVRMLGSSHDADDVVQEAWIRASRAGIGGIDNPAGWLTTITSRLCLDALRARRLSGEVQDLPSHASGPESEALAADAVGVALNVLLASLEPAQRLAFVLHDVFAVPFDEVAVILDRSVVAVRQLASRARATVRAARPVAAASADRKVVDAFLRASREGDLPGLVALLAPDAVVRADPGAAAMGSPSLAGRDAIAGFFDGAAKSARRAEVDGAAGLFWAIAGEVKVVFEFTVVDDAVAAIDLIGTPEVLEAMELVPLTSRD